MSSTRFLLLAGAALFLLAACAPGDRRSGMIPPPTTDAGGSSGIAPGRLVTSLSSTEIQTLCEYVAAVTAGPPVECDGGPTFDPITAAQCMGGLSAPPAGCTATVGNVEACFEAVGSTPCTAFSSPACAPILACGSAG